MRSSRRGIVIVSILVLTLLATFFLGALIQMNPGRLRRSLHDENRDRASLAARAGIDYVLNRYTTNLNWSGSANGETVAMDDLVVREDGGNILGWIKTEDGSWAGFRLRFNAQDGPGGLDGRDDPQYPLATTEMCLNNLTSAVDVLPTTTPGFAIPPNSLALAVEGIVAPGLDPADPKGLASVEGATTRTLEGIFVVSNLVTGGEGDAVLMAGADANVTVGDKPRIDEAEKTRDRRGVLGLQSSADNVAAVRAKGRLNLTRGQSGGGSSKFDPDANAAVHVSSSSPFSEILADGTTFEGGVEETDATFQKIEWEKVKDSQQSTAVSLPGGVYVFTEGDSDSGRTKTGNIKYFDTTWSDYRAKLLAGQTPPESDVPQAFLDLVELDAEEVTLTGKKNGAKVVFTEKRDLIRLKGDVTVNGANGLTIVPQSGALQKAGDEATDVLHVPNVNDETVPQDIEIVFDPAEGNKSAFIRSTGNIFLGTHLSGRGGGVISSKKVDLVGPGVGEGDRRRLSLSIYGKDGINISSFDARRNNYLNLQFDGAVFTENNLSIRLGQDPLGNGGENPEWGVLDFEGSMIALSSDTLADPNGTGFDVPRPVDPDPGDTRAGGTDGLTESGTAGGDDDDDGTPIIGGGIFRIGGRADMTARGVRLFYEPRYLAPFLEESEICPNFTALSLSER